MQRVPAHLSWALIGMGATLFLGSLLWSMLNGPVHQMHGLAIQASAGSKAATGADRVLTAWQLWPAWFGFALMFWGWRRAVNESRRVP